MSFPHNESSNSYIYPIHSMNPYLFCGSRQESQRKQRLSIKSSNLSHPKCHSLENYLYSRYSLFYDSSFSLKAKNQIVKCNWRFKICPCFHIIPVILLRSDILIIFIFDWTFRNFPRFSYSDKKEVLHVIRKNNPSFFPSPVLPSIHQNRYLQCVLNYYPFLIMNHKSILFFIAIRRVYASKRP